MTLVAEAELGPDLTALVVVGEDAGAGLLEAARAAEVLTVLVESGGTARNGRLPHERVVVSHGGSAFHGSELDLVLRSNGVRTVLLAGAAPGRLLMDARDALQRGYRATVAVPEPGAAAALCDALFAGTDARPGVRGTDPPAVWGSHGTPARGWHPDVKRATLLPFLHQRLDPAHTALVLVDVQNDFCRVKRHAHESFTTVERALPNIALLLAAARSAGSAVVHVQAEYGPMFRAPGQPYRYPGSRPGQVVWTASAAEFGANGPELPPDEVEVCRAGTWGEAFVGIEPLPGEVVLRKHRYSAFIDTGLDVLLRHRGVRTVVVAGVATNVCVESTARDAAMMDFYVVVAGDACGTRSPDQGRHDRALAELAACFGTVVPAQRVLDAWQDATPRLAGAA